MNDNTTPHTHAHHHCACDHDHNEQEAAALASRAEQVFAKYDFALTLSGVEARVQSLIADKWEQNQCDAVYRRLLSMVELTTLTVEDSQESVLRMVEDVNRIYASRSDLPAIATICVYPRFAEVVHESLDIDQTRVACVSGAFPSSQTFLEIKTAETALALRDGADEIDMVLSVGAFQSGDYETCIDEIMELKEVCREAPLKVILETGVLANPIDIKKASLLAIYAGADFIKTSTGKTPVSATLEAVAVMCDTIREYHQQTGTWVGLKVAGGIKTVQDAVQYYTLVREILGDEFIQAGHMRIGTSRLFKQLLEVI